MKTLKSSSSRILLIFGIVILTFNSLGAAAVMDTLIVHYFRFDGDYGDWGLWTWNAKSNDGSKEIKATAKDSNGLLFNVIKNEYGDGTQIGLLPKYKNWEGKDGPDRIYNPSLGDEIWIIQGDGKLYNQKPDLRPAIQAGYVDTTTVVDIILNKSVSPGEIKVEDVSIQTEKGVSMKVKKVELEPVTAAKSRTVKVTMEESFDIAHDPVSQYHLGIKGFNGNGLALRRVLDSTDFYSNVELGAIYKPEKTIFRVFAPSASGITLNLYNEPTGGVAKSHKMVQGKHGVWEITINEDLKNKYYTLKATGADKRFQSNLELLDPYSKSNTAIRGRGMIVDDKTPITDRPKFDISDAIIYEMHIRDLTIDANSGVKNKGKYIGITETGTSVPGKPEIKTALDHIVELGVNAVQIMPFQQFEHDESKDDYNWGYMPIHFNSPDGWYATERSNGKRVEEVKKMVDALHKKGIKVIMDVVYNHTAENDSGHIFSFNGLIPGYYYRLKEDGTYWNGSGTGNEFRSEAPMARKFLVDSLKYWVKEYKVDGFRFDLLGLIDLKTVQEAVKELHALDPDIFVYGEPWAGGDTKTPITGKGSQRSQGFAVFNDGFRNAIKGSVFGNDKGYVQNGSYVGDIKKGVQGSIKDFTDSPTETINYSECHDNHTLWDKLVITTRDDKSVTDADRIKMDKLSALILFTAQGVPFIQTGQEFLRSKGGEENSYNKPDSVNEVHWQSKIDHADVFHYYQGLIQIRKNHPMFRLKTKKDVLDNVKFLDDDLKSTLPSNCIGYKITKGNSGDSWNECLVLLNPNSQKMVIPIPDGRWIVVANEQESGDKPVRSGQSTITGWKVDIAPRSGMILYH